MFYDVTDRRVAAIQGDAAAAAAAAACKCVTYFSRLYFVQLDYVKFIQAIMNEHLPRA